jgi:hypothetical protein
MLTLLQPHVHHPVPRRDQTIVVLVSFLRRRSDLQRNVSFASWPSPTYHSIDACQLELSNALVEARFGDEQSQLLALHLHIHYGASSGCKPTASTTRHDAESPPAAAAAATTTAKPRPRAARSTAIAPYSNGPAPGDAE